MNFKIYDPIAQFIATGGGGLPLTGGSLSGNLTLIPPAKVVQCQLPTSPCDLVNLQYFQSQKSVSQFTGTDPNISSPTDRPATFGIIYMGTDNNIWIYNGSTYSAINGQKLNAFAKTADDQSMNITDFVQFSPLTINTTSTQGLTVSDSLNGSQFTFVLGVGRPSVKVKLTISISALTSSAIAKFFTFNITSTTFTDGPGIVLDNNAIFTSTHTYSEILTIFPGTLEIGVALKNSTAAPINIGDGVETYRWILIEEL